MVPSGSRPPLLLRPLLFPVPTRNWVRIQRGSRTIPPRKLNSSKMHPLQPLQPHRATRLSLRRLGTRIPPYLSLVTACIIRAGRRRRTSSAARRTSYPWDRNATRPAGELSGRSITRINLPPVRIITTDWCSSGCSMGELRRPLHCSNSIRRQRSKRSGKRAGRILTPASPFPLLAQDLCPSRSSLVPRHRRRTGRTLHLRQTRRTRPLRA
mmetsp:Transcript_3476/g.9070  ORF Transcript_3476/g.9070 Transcript_3476/m.9070 type:complete len:211 (-) Transcript_3476:2656-3288(-)